MSYGIKTYALNFVNKGLKFMPQISILKYCDAKMLP